MSENEVIVGDGKQEEQYASEAKEAPIPVNLEESLPEEVFTIDEEEKKELSALYESMTKEEMEIHINTITEVLNRLKEKADFMCKPHRPINEIYKTEEEKLKRIKQISAEQKSKKSGIPDNYEKIGGSVLEGISNFNRINTENVLRDEEGAAKNFNDSIKNKKYGLDIHSCMVPVINHFIDRKNEDKVLDQNKVIEFKNMLLGYFSETDFVPDINALFSKLETAEVYMHVFKKQEITRKEFEFLKRKTAELYKGFSLKDIEGYLLTKTIIGE